MKKVSGRLKLDLASYFELEAFSQFSSDLDENTKKTLERGKRTVLSLVQKQDSPYSLSEEVLVLYAVSNGFLDKIEIEKINTRIREFLIYISQNNPEIFKKINENKALTDEISNNLQKLCQEFFK